MAQSARRSAVRFAKLSACLAAILLLDNHLVTEHLLEPSRRILVVINPLNGAPDEEWRVRAERLEHGRAGRLVLLAEEVVARDELRCAGRDGSHPLFQPRSKLSLVPRAAVERQLIQNALDNLAQGDVRAMAF